MTRSIDVRIKFGQLVIKSINDLKVLKDLVNNLLSHRSLEDQIIRTNKPIHLLEKGNKSSLDKSRTNINSILSLNENHKKLQKLQIFLQDKNLQIQMRKYSQRNKLIN